MASELRVNGEITNSPVRLVKADGSMAGVIDINDALKAASEANLDLVEVGPQSSPPVCKLMDYGKYKFEQKARYKQNKKSHSTGGGLKEIRMRFKTDDGDFKIKENRARKFLNAGNRLQLTMILSGREMTRKEMAIDVINRFSLGLDDCAKVEREPKAEGRKVVMILSPKKK